MIISICVCCVLCVGPLLQPRSKADTGLSDALMQVVQIARDLSTESGSLVIGSSMKARQSEQSKLQGKVPPGTLLYGRAQLLDAILKQDHSFGKLGELAVLD